jgi:ferritin
MKEIFEHFEDEMEDACEYLKKAEAAKSEGHHYLANGLFLMAEDEYSHAKFLRDYLITKKVYHDHEHHEELEAKWHRLRQRLGYEE